jgi:glycosyltransferase involved in cell wall biosynthesis
MINYKYLFNNQYLKLKNILTNEFYSLSYIVEPKHWTTYWIGKNIAKNLNRQKLIKTRVSEIPAGIKHQIIHFGSRNTYFDTKNLDKNKVILTWYHLDPNFDNEFFIKRNKGKIDLFHTSSSITKNELIKLGINKDKIIMINIGVDLDIFKNKRDTFRKNVRNKLGIAQNRFVIGSFQKDGVGWEEGLEPKLIKGPDILIEVMKKMKKQINPFVLLSGPARGYVKKEFGKNQIDFIHINARDFKEMSNLYQALDLTLVTSRTEGGPKQILEAMACGVPLVTTPVGLSFDLLGKNYPYISKKTNGKELSQLVLKIYKNTKLSNKLVKKNLNIIKSYSWKKVALRFYKELYKPLLHE